MYRYIFSRMADGKAVTTAFVNLHDAVAHLRLFVPKSEQSSVCEKCYESFQEIGFGVFTAQSAQGSHMALVRDNRNSMGKVENFDALRACGLALLAGNTSYTATSNPDLPYSVRRLEFVRTASAAECPEIWELVAQGGKVIMRLNRDKTLLVVNLPEQRNQAELDLLNYILFSLSAQFEDMGDNPEIYQVWAKDEENAYTDAEQAESFAIIANKRICMSNRKSLIIMPKIGKALIN